MTSTDTHRIMVVGLHRARLSKIMNFVEEGHCPQGPSQGDMTSSPLHEKLSVEFLPCLASMSEYKADDGSMVRYLSTFSYHDGSALTRFFDDPDVRESLSAVCMVGYEWQESIDKTQLEHYFHANNIFELPVECVQANEQFDGSLQKEMEFFKGLEDDEKSSYVSNQTMGPSKMAKFVLTVAEKVKRKKLSEIGKLSGSKEEISTEAVDAHTESKTVDDVEKEKTLTSTSPENSRKPPDVDKCRFACRMCRAVLFGEDDLADNHVKNLHNFRKPNYNARRQTTMAACQSIFCNEIVLEWLAPDGQEIEGRLECPKCSYKIGHWRWAGAQCSCGTWITPAIQIPVSKVDRLEPASAMNEQNAMRTVATPILPSSTVR